MKKNTPLSKIEGYSALAATALVMLSSCGDDNDNNDNPNVTYTDVNPDISITSSSNSEATFELDVNGDGINDLKFVAANYSYSYVPPTDINYAYVEELNGSEFVTSEGIVDLGDYIDTLDFITPIAENVEINNLSEDWNDYGFLGAEGSYYGTSLSEGNFLNREGFIGFRFRASGATHYGWARVSLNDDASNITLKDYAFNTVAGEPIKAGER